jgi:hypothetical protein
MKTEPDRTLCLGGSAEQDPPYAIGKSITT